MFPNPYSLQDPINYIFKRFAKFSEKLRWMYYEEYLESVSSLEEGAFLFGRKRGVA